MNQRRQPITMNQQPQPIFNKKLSQPIVMSHSIEIFKAAVSSMKYYFMIPVNSFNRFLLSSATSEVTFNLLKAGSIG